jgi:ABC-type Na+ efflux pump permease subunit
MKTLDVALKDLLRSFRSVSFLAFELVVPLLVSGLFYFAFGGLASDDGVSDLPTIRVQVANQDQARMGFSAGRTLVGLLQAKSLADLLQVTEAADPDSARVAVDCQEADVAIIVPADFTAAVLDSEGHAALELYQDPTLTLAPGIVKGILSQFVDTFAGAKCGRGCH